MVDCSEMKKGDTLVCGDCGLELKVMKECTDCDSPDNTCCSGPCSFTCCDSEMTLKKAKR